MSKSVRLLDFPEGELGEIVDLEAISLSTMVRMWGCRS